ncbi:hypothetical protein [Lewinella cohaerens]|uniref:hypothetical protein n=1 Tax=Lewinella cohaerens TaxID=70995 RepID=UPI00036575FB|nr:hypothetical protein [Lewinella cohaerens]
MIFHRPLSVCMFLLLGCFFPTNGNAQVFRNYATPAPPPEPGVPQQPAKGEKIYTIDTTFQTWQEAEVKWLDADSSILWEKQFSNYSQGRMAKNSQYIGLAGVETIYTDGYASESRLHLDILDLNGTPSGQFVITNTKGITFESVAADETFFYLAYEKYTGSSDRNMFIAQVDAQGNLQWETKIGQRYGTSGTRLLQVSPAGEIVLFAKMYTEVGFDVLTKEGAIKDRKMLYFINEFSPVAFTFRKNGHLLAIGSQRKYVKSETYSSGVVIELDDQYQILQYCQIESPYNDVALDITEDEQGHIYFLTNAEDLKSPYGQRANFSIIGQLDANFELLQTSSFQNTSTGLSLQLAWSPTHGLWSYQRYYNKGQTFALFHFKEDLSIESIWSRHGAFSDPHQLLIADDTFYLGGGSRDSWVVRIPGFY